jgi:serine/threonine protein kinase
MLAQVIPRHIFLQLCTGGDLFSYIINHVKTSYRLYESEAKYIMFQILIGVKYLHDKKISHRGDNYLHPDGETPRTNGLDTDLKVQS